MGPTVRTPFLGAGLMAGSLSHQNQSGGGVTLEETFSGLLDQRRLNPGQFRRAIATASLAGINGSATIVVLGSAPGVSWYVQAVEATLTTRRAASGCSSTFTLERLSVARRSAGRLPGDDLSGGVGGQKIAIGWAGAPVAPRSRSGVAVKKNS